MTRLKLSTFFLMLAIIFWGTLLGGIAYSHLVYFPVYLSALPDSAVLVNGPFRLQEQIFWVSIHPLLIVTLVTTLLLNWKFAARRKLIGITLLVYALALVATSLYFVPELTAFANSPNSSVSTITANPSRRRRSARKMPALAIASVLRLPRRRNIPAKTMISSPSLIASTIWEILPALRRTSAVP